MALQDLYEDFIQNCITGHAGWHQSYMEIVNEVDSERKRLVDNANYHLPDNIFYKLLWEARNGIANKGQAPFTMDQYNAYMEMDGFRLAVENLVKTPYDPARPRIFIDSFDEFVKVFEKCKAAYNRLRREQAKLPKLILNRVAAACTTHVSCIPAEDDFNKVFSWFKTQNVFSNLAEVPNDWLRNNMTLIRKIRAAFQTQIEEKQAGYDEFYLNIFIRYIYETKCPQRRL